MSDEQQHRAPEDAPGAGVAEAEASDPTQREEEDDEEDELKEGVHTTESGVTELRSLCMNCHETATTRLMMVKIPSFREVIVMSTSCGKCGYKTTEAQNAGEIQPHGCRYTLTVTTPEDMNRQVIKQDTALLRIPELDFEIPANSQKGQLNTLEGILGNAVSGLREGQEQRRRLNPEAATLLDQFIEKLDDMKRGISLPFTVVVEDPTGNSFVENPHAPTPDRNLHVEEFTRSAQQNIDLGLYSSEALQEAAQEEEEEGLERVVEGGQESSSDEGSDKEDGEEGEGAGGAEGGRGASVMGTKAQKQALLLLFDSSSKPDVAKEVMQFPVICHACGSRGMENMCVTDIPHFKEVIIMAFLCEKCGFRNNEIRTGGAVSAKGRRITLHVTPASFEEDVRRDLLKSDTAGIKIPQIELDIEQGSLGSMYTTVEGMLNTVKTKLVEGHPFFLGDSAEEGNKFSRFVQKLDQVLAGDIDFDLVVEDPLANSWLFSSYAPAPDPRMTVEEYERTEEEAEGLGLLDMKTENYEEGARAGAAAASGAADGAGDT